MVSTPLSLENSGKHICIRPDFCSGFSPTDGRGESSILFSSEVMRSCDMILSRSALSQIAWKQRSSMVKFSCEANLTARIIRSGSSEKVMLGSSGVRSIPSLRSRIPPKGSASSPKRSAFRHTAIALMVKSRRFWSSSSVPSSTMGLRLSWLYDSRRAPTNSSSQSVPSAV